MSEFSITAAKQYLQWDRDKLVARIAALEAENKRLREALEAWDRADPVEPGKVCYFAEARRLTAEALKEKS